MGKIKPIILYICAFFLFIIGFLIQTGIAPQAIKSFYLKDIKFSEPFIIYDGISNLMTNVMMALSIVLVISYALLKKTNTLQTFLATIFIASSLVYVYQIYETRLTVYFVTAYINNDYEKYILCKEQRNQRSKHWQKTYIFAQEQYGCEPLNQLNLQYLQSMTTKNLIKNLNTKYNNEKIE